MRRTVGVVAIVVAFVSGGVAAGAAAPTMPVRASAASAVTVPRAILPTSTMEFPAAGPMPPDAPVLLASTGAAVFTVPIVGGGSRVERREPAGVTSWSLQGTPATAMAINRDDEVLVWLGDRLVSIDASGRERFRVTETAFSFVGSAVAAPDGSWFVARLLLNVAGQLGTGRTWVEHLDAVTGATLDSVELGPDRGTTDLHLAADGTVVATYLDFQSNMVIDRVFPGPTHPQLVVPPSAQAPNDRLVSVAGSTVAVLDRHSCYVHNSHVLHLVDIASLTERATQAVPCSDGEPLRMTGMADGSVVLLEEGQPAYPDWNGPAAQAVVAFDALGARRWSVTTDFFEAFGLAAVRGGTQVVVAGAVLAPCVFSPLYPNCRAARMLVIDGRGRRVAEAASFVPQLVVGTSDYSPVPVTVTDGANGFAVGIDMPEHWFMNPHATPRLAVFDSVAPFADYAPQVPERVLETRSSEGQIGYRGATPADGATVVLDLSSRLAAGDGAVALNVTVTNAAADGFVTVWPCDAPRPRASNVNVGAGATAANVAMSKVAAGGTVCLFTQRSADLIVDLQGVYPAGSVYQPLVPSRVLETRAAEGQVGYQGSTPADGATVRLDLRSALGVSGLGPAGAGAVVLNVTVTGSAGDGFVTVWPCDAARPTASNLNVPAGGTRANAVVSGLSADGAVCLFTQRSADLVVDLQGTLPSDGSYQPVVPRRVLETRASEGQIGYAGPRPAAGATVAVRVPAELRAEGGAVALNVTVTNAAAAGYVTVWPCDATRPAASNTNVVAGATVANAVVSKVASDGTVCVYTQPAADLVVDVLGVVPGR